MSQTDQQLIAAFCDQDDNAAFAQLVLRYQDRLVNSLTRILRSHEAACDTAQDAFLQAFRKLHTFRRESQFYTWLFRIAMNKAISQKRRDSKAASTSLDAVREKSGTDAVDSNPTIAPGHRIEQQEQHATVHRALNDLPDEYRTVLVLQAIDGMSYEEIATVLDCPVGTVRSRLHRARMELRDRLERTADFS